MPAVLGGRSTDTVFRNNGLGLTWSSQLPLPKNCYLTIKPKKFSRVLNIIFQLLDYITQIVPQSTTVIVILTCSTPICHMEVIVGGK
jgi:hypothetical protein